jgi:transcription elongation factor Elf1
MANRCDYAETFPATLDKCKRCGGKDVNIASISYGDKIATAIYLCQRCRTAFEHRKYRRLRVRNNGD